MSCGVFVLKAHRALVWGLTIFRLLEDEEMRGS